MKLIHKSAALTLIAILVMSLFGLALAASDSGKAGDDIRWELKQDGSLVIYGSGSINKSVPWSYYYNDITSIEVGEGITDIPDDAFYGCQKVTSVTLPSTLTKIGDRAFYGCKKLTELAIPGAVKKLGDYAFGSTSLTTIVLGEGITEIWDDAFYGCDKLESINIPESVEEIGDRAFYGCKKLKQLSIVSAIYYYPLSSFRSVRSFDGGYHLAARRPNVCPCRKL